MNEVEVNKFQERFDVSRETIDRLGRYEKLVEKWNPVINLVSKNSINNLWERHFTDSAQLFKLAGRPERWVDLGSGGGFPGLVIGCLAIDKTPGLELHLVESDQRKAAFLSTVCRELDISAKIHADRIEKISSLQANVISARALASLSDLLSLSEMHKSEGATYLFPKGARWKDEIEETKDKWKFDFDPIPSITDPAAVILQISGVERV